MSLEGRRLRRRPWSLDIFPSRFRRSDGRGRPFHSVARASTPASRIVVGGIFSRNDIVDGSTHTGIPEGANRRLHTRVPEGLQKIGRRFSGESLLLIAKHLHFQMFWLSVVL